MAKDKVKKYKLGKILDYLGVAFLGGILLLVWQLYKGPIEVPYLKPYIIKALNSDDATYQISLDSVNIELVRSIQPIKIIANNIVFKKNDDSFIINAPRYYCAKLNRSRRPAYICVYELWRRAKQRKWNQ